MLLKVDVITELDGEEGISQTVYVSPCTAKHHTDHILLQIGRKDSDVVFKDEKSVSRKHCCLRLLSLSSDENGVGGKCRNENEELACQKTQDGLIAVLEDLGR